MTFESIRSQEPPQARLLRLRGLFDLLLDRDSSSALAGGRAKQVWRTRASRARYGAGGSLATGSLVSCAGPAPNIAGEHPVVNTHEKHESVSPSTYLREWFSNVRRQSYANELLAQCRTCHAEMEKAQQQLEAKKAERRKTNGGGFARYFGFGGEAKPSDTPPTTRAWYNLIRMAKEYPLQGDPADTDESWWSEAMSHLFGKEKGGQSLLKNLESGWTGSRVWGLSASEEKKTRTLQNTQISSDKKDPSEVEHAARARQRHFEWEGFLAYAEFQERELYRLFKELDTDHDGVLDASDISAGFSRAGIHPSQLVLEDFIASLASSGVTDVSELRKGDLYITFPEFRDYLLLMPRKPTMSEIFRFYQVRKAVGLFGNEGIFAELGAGWGKTKRGASAVTPDGDVSLAGEEHLPGKDSKSTAKDAKDSVTAQTTGKTVDADAEKNALSKTLEDEDEDEGKDVIQSHLAMKFLLAGGIAGAVSRTATAPLDRLKIFLITSQETLGPHAPKSARVGFGALAKAIADIYREGGIRGFWLGNGLNCIKIFPESAIKFFSYEMSKRMFAKYVDNVSDSRDISGFSRFMSGGIGGITSQLCTCFVFLLTQRFIRSRRSRRASCRARRLRVPFVVWRFWGRQREPCIPKAVSVPTTVVSELVLSAFSPTLLSTCRRLKESSCSI